MAKPVKARIQLVHGDITQLDADAVVTAANESLCGGGGVDGAVHASAGPDLLVASRAVAPCPPGNARVTPGFNLNTNFVIHAVGPKFWDLETDSKTLAATYESALMLATENNVARIAFPCISTGAYGFSHRNACEIVIATVLGWLRTNNKPELIIFCCYEQHDAELNRSRLEALGIDS